jgi:hypothetical protein
MTMASQEQVKEYLAYWFQLGKKVLIHNGQAALYPQPVIEGDHYSRAFEACWQQILLPESGICYLEGTEQTVEQLLSSAWIINSCPRCQMPVPMIDLGVQSPGCPCLDLPSWPNPEIPAPRSPINNSTYLNRIKDRLQKHF